MLHSDCVVTAITGKEKNMQHSQRVPEKKKKKKKRKHAQPIITHNFSSTEGRPFCFWVPWHQEWTSQVIFLFLFWNICRYPRQWMTPGWRRQVYDNSKPIIHNLVLVYIRSTGFLLRWQRFTGQDLSLVWHWSWVQCRSITTPSASEGRLLALLCMVSDGGRQRLQWENCEWNSSRHFSCQLLREGGGRRREVGCQPQSVLVSSEIETVRELCSRCWRRPGRLHASFSRGISAGREKCTLKLGLMQHFVHHKVTAFPQFNEQPILSPQKVISHCKSAVNRQLKL